MVSEEPIARIIISLITSVHTKKWMNNISKLFTILSRVESNREEGGYTLSNLDKNVNNFGMLFIFSLVCLDWISGGTQSSPYRLIDDYHDLACVQKIRVYDIFLLLEMYRFIL